eukprot:COSAG06_NODE_16433_length_1001_cov_6793.332594_1_plen_36_part_01
MALLRAASGRARENYRGQFHGEGGGDVGEMNANLLS